VLYIGAGEQSPALLFYTAGAYFCTMTRHAQCQCGSLQVDTDGEPDSVVVCNCTACQRRSGSPLGEGAYYARERLTFVGEVREFVRKTDAGNTFHAFFCPTCATSLYFFSSRDPNRVGIAVGAFADPSFPKPQRSVFEESKHAWIGLPADMEGFVRGRDSDRSR